jgi:hypothetical protein
LHLFVQTISLYGIAGFPLAHFRYPELLALLHNRLHFSLLRQLLHSTHPGIYPITPLESSWKGNMASFTLFCFNACLSLSLEMAAFTGNQEL